MRKVTDQVKELLNMTDVPTEMTPEALVHTVGNLAVKLVAEKQDGFLVVYDNRFAVQPYPAEDYPSLLLCDDLLMRDKLPEGMVLDLVEFLLTPQSLPI